MRLPTQLGALVDGARTQPRAAMPTEEIELLRKLAMRYPRVATQYRYAVAWGLNGQQPEAARQFLGIRAKRGEKLYQKIRKEIGELARTGNPELLDLP